MRLLVFQHTPSETPGAFGRYAEKAGDTVEIVHLYRGMAIPDLMDFTHLLVMGGPMDVWEVAENPWLTPEIEAIGEWVGSGRPYLGICLGHQLLAEATGGRCAKMAMPEIGVTEVMRFGDDPLLQALPAAFPALHWHGVEVKELPKGAQPLGLSAGCGVQAMRVGDCAWGLQFHPELEPGTITGWMNDPENLACARDWLGTSKAARAFVQEAETQVEGMMERSASLYRAFRSL